MPITVSQLKKAAGGSGITPAQLKQLEAQMNDESLSPEEREAARVAFTDGLEEVKKALEGLPKLGLATAVSQIAAQLSSIAQPVSGELLSPLPASMRVPAPTIIVDHEARQWDYCRVVLKEGNGGYVVSHVSPNLEQDSRIMENLGLDALLAFLGDDKWDLAVNLGTDTNPTLVFKRPR